jgi:hypothetical protein
MTEGHASELIPGNLPMLPRKNSQTYSSPSNNDHDHTTHIPRFVPILQAPISARPLPAGFRSVSLDNVHIHRSDSYRRKRMASGWQDLTLGTQTHRESPWSLFGQLMESEGQLGGLDSPRLRRRPSNNDIDRSQPSLSAFSEVLTPFITPNEQRRSRSMNGSPESCTLRPIPDQPPEYDSDTSETAPDLTPVSNSDRRKADSLPSMPMLYRNILKCAIAYFIASLFTFSPYLSGFISDITSHGSGERRPSSPSGHMVATV